MKIQFAYYLPILAAAAGANAVLASTCVYDCLDPDGTAVCSRGWGPVWNPSLKCDICCTTSLDFVGDEETPHEVIHLAAGLQFSGFKSVIGTLWEVDDSVAQHVVEAFYKNMFKDLENGGVMDCAKAAWALNRATHSVKTKVPLEQRMVFVHIDGRLGQLSRLAPSRETGCWQYSRGHTVTFSVGKFKVPLRDAGNMHAKRITHNA
ncbi:hypothetical protein BD769DRAFT_1754181 [Suillus cothurnatus]|nr:hypothetical protein BD769DRAFT_1754181 [Suillus cothurnatus]